MFSSVMIHRFLLSLMVLAILFLGGCKETRVTSDQVLATIDSVETELNWLDYRLNLEHWQVINGQPSDSLEFFQSLHRSYFRDSDKLGILRPNQTLVKSDEIATRKYNLIVRHLLQGYVEASPAISSLRDSLLGLATTHPPQIGSEILSWDQIDHILAFSNDRTRRELAFRAKSGNGELMAEAMGQLIRIRNQEASRLGYNDYFAMTFPTEGMSLDEYRRLLDELEEATSVPYQAILDRIGNDQVEPWGLIYELSGPLQELNNRPAIDSQWILTYELFSELGFDLNKLPIYTQLTASPNDPAGVTGIAINPPYDQRVVGNLGSSVTHTSNLVRTIARLIHANSISESSPLFVNAVDKERA